MEDDAFPWRDRETQRALTYTLSMNLYDVSIDTEDGKHSLIRWLVSLARDINEYFESLDYPWLSSLPPQFGVHKDHDGRLSLRGLCRYGESVADEWRCLRALMDFTNQASLSETTRTFVAECWDEDDGPIILIQAAEHLPSTLSDGSHTGGRYRSWIKSGQIHFLLKNPDRELSLQESLEIIRQDGLSLARLSIQNEIRSTFDSPDSEQWQQTVIIVQEKNAPLLSNQPELIHAAIQNVASEKHAYKPTETASQPCDSCKQIWLPIRLGRTSYAMLRSMIPDESIVYYEMGEMIEYGVSAIRKKHEENKVDRKAAWREHIIENDIDKAINIDAFLGCPVFDGEVKERQFTFGDRKPTTSVNAAELRVYDGSNSPIKEGAFDLDTDSWMFLSDNDADQTKVNGVNSVHKGLNAFFTGDSSTEGVHGKTVNYGKVLRILRTALQSSTADEFQYKLNAEFDPFFTREDYDLVSPGINEYDSMESVMESMDNELNRNRDEGSAVEVMSNLLQSLGSGGPGPARHLLNEMNQTAPNVTEQDFSTE